MKENVIVHGAIINLQYLQGTAVSEFSVNYVIYFLKWSNS